MKREIITIENRVVSVPAPNNIWMTQHELADLFEYFVSKVGSHIHSILKSGVLCESNVCRTYHYQNGSFVKQYNLEMIVALSFRIESKNAEIFRKWLMRKLSKTKLPEMLIMSIKNPILN
jgi:hypothetical protein